MVSEISESRQPIYGENDDEGRKLAAKIDAKIKSIKFTFPRDSLLSNVTNIDPQASSERTQPSPDIHTHARRNMGEKDSLSQSPVQKNTAVSLIMLSAYPSISHLCRIIIKPC